MILGGGFGGVGAARKLKDADADVVLIDKHDYHTFHRCCTRLPPTCSSGPPSGIRCAISSTTSRTSQCTRQPLPQSTWRRNRSASRRWTPLTYDYLVLALGAQVNFFGIPGAAKHAFPMYTLADAVRLKDHVLERWEAADRDRP